MGILLTEYAKVNKEIKDENYELTQDNTQLEQLTRTCSKELEKCCKDKSE